MGFLWFGTQDGLNVYDGKKIKIFRYDPDDPGSLVSNYLRCSCEDKYGNLWFGTNEGLCRYRREKNDFEVFINDSNDINSISGNQIRAICEDSYGNLWIGTYNNGLNRYDQENDIFEKYLPDTDGETGIKKIKVNTIFCDSAGKIWIGTWGGGVLSFDFKEKKFTDVKLTDNYPSNSGISRINNIFEDRKGNIFISSNLGLFVREKNENEFTHFIHEDGNNNSIRQNLVSFVFEDSGGNLWVGTREEGLNLFELKEQKFFNLRMEKDNPYSLNCNSIWGMIEDSSGILWIGTNTGGLNKFNRKSLAIDHYRSLSDVSDSLSSNLIRCLFEDSEGIIWIGTLDNGLNKLDRKTDKLTNFKTDQNAPDCICRGNINSIIETDKDTLWISPENQGLWRMNKLTGEFKQFRNVLPEKNILGQDTILKMVYDNDGIIWLGTLGGGLNSFNINKGKFTNFTFDEKDPLSLSSNRIRDVIKVRNDILWIGTDIGGLNKFDIKEQKFIHFKNEAGNVKSISNNTVISLLEDSSGNIWAGTFGGLNKFDASQNTFKRYTVNDGLPNDAIYKLMEDNEKNIWISTNYGLSKLDPATETFINYDVRDGFQGNAYYHQCGLKLKGGELAFGGGNGFDIFRPEDITENETIPNIVITDLQIFNKPVPISENGSVLDKSISLKNEIELSYKDSVFSFEFAALDFTVPGKNKYAYKLIGFDRDWSYSGYKNQATYTNLDPGKYIFRVKGSNNDDIWNEKGVSLKINISPPFWKTMWFKGLGVLAVAGAAGKIYNNKLRKIREEQKAQAEFTKQLIEVQENDRKRISAELHDSIGSDLLISKNKLQMSLKNPEITKSVEKNISEVSNIITDTLKDVREISYSLHPYQIERLGLSKAIKSITDRAAGSTDMSFIFSADNIDKLLKPEVEISLYRIIQECINNILKHSRAESVILNISKSGNILSVLISDNGIGFSLEKIKSNASGYGFGLKGISERVKLFDGKFEINSSVNYGTEMKISIPF